jgi:hypothetical protein
MAMTDEQRSALIERWTWKSSDSEQERMERAERMVRDAINSHPPLQAYAGSFKIYAKGSYSNETNVRQDSDVDIVVENHDVYYFDYISNETAQAATQNPSFVPYTGPWQASNWRAEVTTALEKYFGASDVDTSGNVAITIAEVTGSRPSADVVPAFDYRRYDRADRSSSSTHSGSKVFKKDGSGVIINYPDQQKRNGGAKDRRTRGKYKEFARALKNGENALIKAGLMKEKPLVPDGVPRLQRPGPGPDARLHPIRVVPGRAGDAAQPFASRRFPLRGLGGAKRVEVLVRQ